VDSDVFATLGSTELEELVCVSTLCQVGIELFTVFIYLFIFFKKQTTRACCTIFLFVA